MTIVNYINISLEIWGCIMSAVVALCLFLGKRPHDLCFRIYIHMLACNFGALFFDVLALLFRGHSGAFFWFGVRAANFIAFSCNYLLMVSFVHYLTEYLGQRAKVSQTPLKVSRVVCALSIGMIILTQFYPVFYTIDAQNLYHRASSFWLSHAMGIVCLFLCARLLVRHQKSLNPQEKAGLWSYILLPLTALIAQMFIYGLVLLGLANTVSLVVVFLFLVSEQGRRMAEAENDLTQSRISIMLSQIQPHFLYNALAVIQDLCHDKAPEAEQATIEFSKFLRSNLDSIKADKPIPFEREVLHAKNYLALEQKRFGQRLLVEWEIETTAFLIPALTLQPVVENAVRYGVTKRKDGGTVKISVKETDLSYEVIVADDGIGFDVNAVHEDGRTHIGISNVKERLHTMCGGELEITSTQGVGTVAVLTIPKEGK